LREHGNANRLAGTCRQNDRTTNDLVRLLRIDAELNCDVDRLVELRARAFLHECQCVFDRVQLLTIDLRLNA
jgi:hypothetical protein